MKEKCNNCVYACPVDIGEDSEMLRACVYILHEYRKRPCPAGKDCTVYKPRERRRSQWL